MKRRKKSGHNKMTDKQRETLKDVLDGVPVVKAMIKNGYSVRTANDHPERFKESPLVKNAMEAALRRRGISEDKLAEKIEEGMEAVDPKYQSPDHYARHKFVVTGLELMGHLDKKPDAANVNVGIFVLPSEKSAEEWTKKSQ